MCIPYIIAHPRPNRRHRVVRPILPHLDVGVEAHCNVSTDSIKLGHQRSRSRSRSCSATPSRRCIRVVEALPREQRRCRVPDEYIVIEKRPASPAPKKEEEKAREQKPPPPKTCPMPGNVRCAEAGDERWSEWARAMMAMDKDKERGRAPAPAQPPAPAPAPVPKNEEPKREVEYRRPRRRSDASEISARSFRALKRKVSGLWERFGKVEGRVHGIERRFGGLERRESYRGRELDRGWERRDLDRGGDRSEFDALWSRRRYW